MSRRPHLFLLHGALGASTQFRPLLPFLQNKFDVHTLDFEGHGASPLKNRPLRLKHFAENAVAYLDTTAGLDESIRIFRLLQKGELQVFPDTPHPLEKVSMRNLAGAISNFFL